MATITGTQGEKVDQITQLFLAQQGQIRLMQWIGGIFIPVLIVFASWLVLTVNSTKLEIVALQGKIELVNQRVEQSEKALNQRMDQMEKTLAKIDEHLNKIDERLSKIDERLNKIDERLNKLEKKP
jgi:septal ring factor EnvC (AmiA/AmiB activator)